MAERTMTADLEFHERVNSVRLSADLIDRLPLISTGDDRPTPREVMELASHLMAARAGYQKTARRRSAEVSYRHRRRRVFESQGTHESERAMTTNPDDLSAACERLLANKYDDGEMFENSGGGFLSNTGELDYSIQKAADQALLARAYLAQQQQPRRVDGDDDEPVSEDWLRSIGFQPGHLEAGLWLQSTIGINAELECVVCNARPKITNRGDVRRLAACIGIELKEPTNG